MGGGALQGGGGGGDRRLHERIPLTVRALLFEENESEPRTVKTQDVSDGGVLLVVEDPKPPVGSVIRLQVIGLGEGDAPIVAMKVMRMTAHGIGCAYV